MREGPKLEVEITCRGSIYLKSIEDARNLNFVERLFDENPIKEESFCYYENKMINTNPYPETPNWCPLKK